MRKVTCFAVAAMLAASSCFAAPAKVATQDWVKKALSAVGVRVSDTVVKTNVADSATGSVVTNLTFTSPYTCAEVPDCRAVSFTVSLPKMAYRQACAPKARNLWELLVLAAYADGDVGVTVDMAILSGSWTDKSGAEHNFVFEGGWVVELRGEENLLPSKPTGTHKCTTIDTDCICVQSAKTESELQSEAEGKYKDVNVAEFYSKYGDIGNWVDLDAWGGESWQKVQKLPGNRGSRYFVCDDEGNWFNIEDLWVNSSALLDAVAQTVDNINDYMKECRDAYVEANTCKVTDPQHIWQSFSCGGIVWEICQRNNAHKNGAEDHSFPGAGYNTANHFCVCGLRMEGHSLGEWVQVSASGGEITYEQSCEICPYKNTKKEACQHIWGEWEKASESGNTAIYERMCKVCFKLETKTHVHKFVNCNPCSAGDDCTKLCACEGKHQFGMATASACAMCECPSSEGCNGKPPEDNMDLHSGWLPCSEHVEEDNDDGTAKGGHCQCQCLTFGHNNDTRHDYQNIGSEDICEKIDGDDANHYTNLKRCSRCPQSFKKKEPHDYPENPTGYTKKSDEICRKEYKCQSQGCGYIKYDNEGSHSLGNKVVYENVGSSICRKKSQCDNCKGWITDDSNGHERNASDGCKCKNGCGYVFSHEWEADPCGNDKCKHCKSTKQGVVQFHKGHKDVGDVHRCLCGEDSAPHDIESQPWVRESVSVGLIHYVRSCTGCSKSARTSQACKHEWGPWVEAGRLPGAVTYISVCQVCGAEKSNTVAEGGDTPCNEEIDFHVPNADTCGCACGKYGANGKASTEKRMHKWSTQTDGNGVQHCMCKCGRFHEQRAASTYMVNRDEVCGNVCAYCREKAGTGIDIGKADDSLHTPNEAKDGNCGCKCGALDHSTNLEQFHIQKPGSCCCLGADGNGGSWHFREPQSSCSKVCKYDNAFDGKHLVAASKKEIRRPRKAVLADHDVRTDAACGCACGEYSSSNIDDWKFSTKLHKSDPNNCGCYCGFATPYQLAEDFHKKANEFSCECACEMHEVISHVWNSGNCECNCQYHDKQHKKINNGKCLAVCHGPCGEANDQKKMTSHTPSSTECGCDCGAFGGEYYEAAKFHQSQFGTCSCKCGNYHFFEAKDGCVKVCRYCGWDIDKEKTGSKIHDFGDACICKCGDWSREHLWGERVPAESISYTCGTCGNEITSEMEESRCQRACDAVSSYAVNEIGHTGVCVEGGEDQWITCRAELKDGNICLAEYLVGDTCPNESEHKSTSSGGGSGGGDSGGGTGGGTGGSGGLDDI